MGCVFGVFPTPLHLVHSKLACLGTKGPVDYRTRTMSSYVPRHGLRQADGGQSFNWHDNRFYVAKETAPYAFRQYFCHLALRFAVSRTLLAADSGCSRKRGPAVPARTIKSAHPGTPLLHPATRKSNVPGTHSCFPPRRKKQARRGPPPRAGGGFLNSALGSPSEQSIRIRRILTVFNPVSSIKNTILIASAIDSYSYGLWKPYFSRL